MLTQHITDNVHELQGQLDMKLSYLKEYYSANFTNLFKTIILIYTH